MATGKAQKKAANVGRRPSGSPISGGNPMGSQRSLQRKSCGVLDHASACRNGIAAKYWQVSAGSLDTARLILRDLPP